MIHLIVKLALLLKLLVLNVKFLITYNPMELALKLVQVNIMQITIVLLNAKVVFNNV